MNNYQDFRIESSYISYGEKNIAHSLINPVLSCTRLYRRSVGFFSSSVISLIRDGILQLAHNNGSIQLIASPKLSSDDIEAIEKGYKNRDDIVRDRFSQNFIDEIEKFSDQDLQMLVELITHGILDIKLALTKGNGIYHDKLGILEDFAGNKIVFYGSANSSYTAYHENYEKIRVVRSWSNSENKYVQNEVGEFDALWNNRHPYVRILDYSDCAKQHLIQSLARRTAGKQSQPIILRDYQEDAINAWVGNNYHGFFVMATGTGKTWTAIYAAKRLVEKHEAMIVICAPYKHLVKQWAEDVDKAFPNSRIILVSSENLEWAKQLSKEIIHQRYAQGRQIIVITTMASFGMPRFMDTITKSTEDKLLIVDEAHRFTNRLEEYQTIYKYMLGLSATPFSGKNAGKGKELMEFFGGEVYALPIEDALKRGFLVPYYYYPLFVYSTPEEEEQFRSYSIKIPSCFKGNTCINPDQLVKLLRGRLRVISMSEHKMEQLKDFIANMGNKDHFVVYCGDGKLIDDSSGEAIRHIQAVKKILSSQGYKVSQFTAKENMSERMNLVNSFNLGNIEALAAIRCLDEGINIPSIESALILSSNDDYREFVQRRGRILRKYKDKKSATIYDIIVLPSESMSSWAAIELRRYREYARLAINGEELLRRLDGLMRQYGLTPEDIDVYNYEDVEVALDE